VQVLGYQNNESAYLWFFNRNATWWNLVAQKRRAEMLDEATVSIEGLAFGAYTVQWWDTYTGEVVQTKRISAQEGPLCLAAPPFRRDIACKIRRP
jgi:hypothetical protein